MKAALDARVLEVVEQAIKEAKNISQWQSVGFWLLEFCMRGLYPA